MNDTLIAHIRTFVPILAGSIVSWLASRGLELDDETTATIATALTGLCIAAYYSIVTLLTKKWPSLSILLGHHTTPIYRKNTKS